MPLAADTTELTDGVSKILERNRIKVSGVTINGDELDMVANDFYHKFDYALHLIRKAAKQLGQRSWESPKPKRAGVWVEAVEVDGKYNYTVKVRDYRGCDHNLVRLLGLNLYT